MFRTLEKHRISESISSGFLGPDGRVDVEAFLKISLSVHNRRKSRAGLSLEEHISAIFTSNGVAYVKKAKTEGKKEPDFLFPSKPAYDDLTFPDSCLTMLGSKTTLKDRWRQVLNEADRIPHKHLLTLQPAISEAQTAEMQAENLQLVIPRGLHDQGFSPAQQDWLMGLDDFIDEVKRREGLAPVVRSHNLGTYLPLDVPVPLTSDGEIVAAKPQGKQLDMELWRNPPSEVLPTPYSSPAPPISGALNPGGPHGK